MTSIFGWSPPAAGFRRCGRWPPSPSARCSRASPPWRRFSCCRCWPPVSEGNVAAGGRLAKPTVARSSGCRARLFLSAPWPHEAEQEAGDLAHLDLLRTLGDAVAPVVAIDVLERLGSRVADAAVHLHGAIGRLAAQPVRPIIAHRHLVGELVLN